MTILANFHRPPTSSHHALHHETTCAHYASLANILAQSTRLERYSNELPARTKNTLLAQLTKHVAMSPPKTLLPAIQPNLIDCLLLPIEWCLIGGKDSAGNLGCGCSAITTTILHAVSQQWSCDAIDDLASAADDDVVKEGVERVRREKKNEKKKRGKEKSKEKERKERDRKEVAEKENGRGGAGCSAYAGAGDATTAVAAILERTVVPTVVPTLAPTVVIAASVTPVKDAPTSACESPQWVVVKKKGGKVEEEAKARADKKRDKKRGKARKVVKEILVEVVEGVLGVIGSKEREAKEERAKDKKKKEPPVPVAAVTKKKDKQEAVVVKKKDKKDPVVGKKKDNGGKKKEAKRETKKEKKKAEKTTTRVREEATPLSPPSTPALPLPPLTLLHNYDTHSLTSSLGEPSVAPPPPLPLPRWSALTSNLTRNIGRFVIKRGVMLGERRRERERLLKGVHERCTTLFPGSLVLPYGSCATGLDLPSSDLDIVITKPAGKGGKVGQQARDRKNFAKPTTIAKNINLLAMALRREAWAVQVKPVLTTAVPLIKMLADPSIIEPVPQDSSNTMLHCSPPPNRSCVDMDIFLRSPEAAATAYTQQLSPPYSPNLTSWRGADTNNNLLAVDISFEGKEHGGITSSQFVEKKIKEDTDGILTEVTLVLKEFLAQKKMNEPFTGGLSSYALLLMTVSVVKQATWRLSVLKQRRRKQQQPEESANPLTSSPSDSSGTTLIADLQPTWAEMILPARRADQQYETTSYRSSNASSPTMLVSDLVIRPSLTQDSDQEVPDDGLLVDEGDAFGFDWAIIDDIYLKSCESSGELKLHSSAVLLHFLFYYGSQFDCLKHVIQAETTSHGLPSSRTDDLTRLDEVTGLPNYDPIVIRNPLFKGAAELNNVAKSCFAWSSLRWFFMQAFTTLDLATRDGEETTEEMSLLELLISF